MLSCTCFLFLKRNNEIDKNKLHLIDSLTTNQRYYFRGQSVVGAKPPGTPASRTWLVSHVLRVGLEPTPDDRMVKCINEMSEFFTTWPRGSAQIDTSTDMYEEEEQPCLSAYIDHRKYFTYHNFGYFIRTF